MSKCVCVRMCVSEYVFECVCVLVYVVVTIYCIYGIVCIYC